jgi:hypothetical protein
MEATVDFDERTLLMERSSPDQTLRLPAISNPPPAVTEPPPWITDIVRKYRLRITDWVSQAWLLTISPRRTLDEWATGKRELLNPLRFTAVGLGICLLLDKGGRWLCHIEPSPTLHGWQAYNQSFTHSSMGMVFSAFVGGTLMHPVLRWKSKAALRSTIAASLYANFGPGVFLTALSWLVCLGLFGFHHKIPLFVSTTGENMPWPSVVAAFLSGPWVVGGFSGAHRVRWWWSSLAYLALPVFGLAVIVTSVFVVVGVMKLFHL